MQIFLDKMRILILNVKKKKNYLKYKFLIKHIWNMYNIKEYII